MKKLLILLALISMPTFAFAAEQGTKGEKSQGSSVVNLLIPEMIIANGFDDITVNVNDKTQDTINKFPTGATDYQASDAICVASNNSRSASNQYSLVVTNSNNTDSTDNFYVTDGVSSKVHFVLTYADSATSETLAPGGTSLTTYKAWTTLTACDSGSNENATYTVTFKATGGTSAQPSIDMVPAGAYSTTLTFLFTPNNESNTY